MPLRKSGIPLWRCFWRTKRLISRMQTPKLYVRLGFQFLDEVAVPIKAALEGFEAGIKGAVLGKGAEGFQSGFGSLPNLP
jgi:hypothetical protein